MIDLILAFYSIIILTVFGYMYKKGGIEFLWLLVVISGALANIIFYFRYYDTIYRLIGNIFYVLAGIILGCSVFKEYNDIFIKKSINQKNSPKNNKYSTIFMFFSLTLINIIQIPFIMYLIIVWLMLLRISFVKKSITYAFMLLALIAVFFTLAFSILRDFDIEGAWEVAYLSKIIFLTFMLATGLSAPIEDRISKSERKYYDAFYRAEFYKDLFAHDISNILQNVQSSMELLNIYSEKPHEKEVSKELITIVKNQVIRGATMVSNIRKLSEIEETEIKLKRVEICEILKKIISYLHEIYEEKKIDIKLENDGTQHYVKANTLLLNVFENILVNAVKHNQNKNIKISIRISDVHSNNTDYVKIEFLDNAMGIPDNIKEDVFQRAFRKEKSVSGMGLGLSLVKKIIEKYDGQIWVEDRIQGDYTKGSNFVLLLHQAT
jgi:signal transduction histidine kinase